MVGCGSLGNRVYVEPFPRKGDGLHPPSHRLGQSMTVPLMAVGLDRSVREGPESSCSSREAPRSGARLWPNPNRLGEFGERSGDACSGRGVHGEFVVAASKVLHEGVSGDDQVRCLARS
jgi:hypothetical protein